MNARSDWQWDEFRHVGADYSDVTEVEEYDRRTAQFRHEERTS